MNKVAESIHGYTYGAPETAASPIPLQQLKALKDSAGMTAEDERYLRLAGEVLADQTGQVVEHWRGRIISGIPNLARHSRTPGRGSNSRVCGQQQLAVSAMDPRYVPAAL